MRLLCFIAPSDCGSGEELAPSRGRMTKEWPVSTCDQGAVHHLSLGRVGGPICGDVVPCSIPMRQSRLAGVAKSGEGRGMLSAFGLWWLLVNLPREVGETPLCW
jgi:hypothetical protein